ncbi:hypothetical protein NUSPORA_01413 [Nucleospora cyclopteri]
MNFEEKKNLINKQQQTKQLNNRNIILRNQQSQNESVITNIKLQKKKFNKYTFNSLQKFNYVN